ncbi:MAG TPA: discoidin domain-containing protein [Planctomycetota bacterium]|jgi:hypothetical protein
MRVAKTTVAALFAIVLSGLLQSAENRADNYEDALARAKAVAPASVPAGKDIVVYQRGSDWNKCAEVLYQTVWLKDELLKELGDGFILVSVDKQETLGNPPLSISDAARTSTSPGDTPLSRLSRIADEKTSLPANEIVSVESAGKIPFAARSDGAFLGAMTPNPGQDALTLHLKAARGGRILRLDFPTDPSLPGGGPGRASNGNFALSEITARSGGKDLKFDAAWANVSEGHWGPWQVIDGIFDKPDNLWNPAAHHHQRRTLLLTFVEAVPAATELSVQLICRSQWGQHVPGCVCAAVLSDASIEADVRSVAQAQLLAAKNAKFSWWDTSRCPRIALMDSQGRAVACENKPRLGLTPRTMAELIKKLRAKREQRDALWAKAEQAKGAEKAELLRQSLDLLEFGGWPGNENCYKFVHDEMRKADPKDESGAVRWLGFGSDVLGGVAWTPGNEWWKVLEGKKEYTDAEYNEALARIDKELKDPRNRVLKKEQIQHIMVAKYHVFKRWPGHQEQRFDVQREIAALDPTTIFGIGAVGYSGMHRVSASPMLTYGWGPKQVKPGLNSWNLTDTAYFFDHAGKYAVSIAHGGGKDGVVIKRISLLDGTTLISAAEPKAPQNEVGPGKKAEVELDLKTWSDDRKLTLRVELEAVEGKMDCLGNFGVEPLLAPPSSNSNSAAPNVTSGPLAAEADALLASGDFSLLHRKLTAALAAAASAQGSAAVMSNTTLKTGLAQAELLRSCGVDKVTEIAAGTEAGATGGKDLLRSMLNNTAWMESFLASGAADFGQSLENLRLLYQYAKDQTTDSLGQRLATAMALQWGAGSRYRLVDRFKDIRRAHREGLLHAAFDGYTVREMRWAIYQPGTAKDFQFLLDERQTPVADYVGACWAVPYIDPNVYGDSVQTWLYITPWTHHFGTGTGNRPFPAHRHIGGVCGTLSGYGEAVSKAHGIMATCVGQPGHCAYCVRVGKEWPVGNDVFGAGSTGFSIYEGTGYVGTTNYLVETVEADRDNFMNAARLCWLARAQMEQSKPAVRVLPELRYSVYRQGVGAALPDFSKLTPEKTGVAKSINLAAVQPSPSDNFGIVWEGNLDVAAAGPVRVATHSDDGSRILIDGQPVVAANCNRQEKEIPLTAGKHALRVEFSQGGGALSLNTSFEGVLSLGPWTSTYEQATAAQPINFNTWLEYIKALEGVKNVPAKTWLDLSRALTKAFVDYHEAAWVLIDRCFEKAAPTMKPDERLAFLLEMHRQLRQEKMARVLSFPTSHILNWQADRIGDPSLAVEFFKQLLTIHYSKNPATNGLFGGVVGWGNERFAPNPAMAAGYAKAMESCFTSLGESADKNWMTNTITAGIRKASEVGDKDSFRLWTNMAEKMLPPLKAGDVHLNPQQAAAFPKIEPFAGVLLSKDGMLQTSSACQHDRPLSYKPVLGAEVGRASLPAGGHGGPPYFGGWFDTNNEEKPWAQVQLAGDAELSGIVLVNRYEFAPTQEEFQWAAPLKISVSTDGKTWKEVATLEKAEAVFRVDLQGKNLRARFVRAERLPNADKSKPPGRLHFRAFLIFGKKLY